jgi:hypothetical protein
VPSTGSSRVVTSHNARLCRIDAVTRADIRADIAATIYQFVHVSHFVLPEVEAIAAVVQGRLCKLRRQFSIFNLQFDYSIGQVVTPVQVIAN